MSKTHGFVVGIVLDFVFAYNYVVMDDGGYWPIFYGYVVEGCSVCFICDLVIINGVICFQIYKSEIGVKIRCNVVFFFNIIDMRRVAVCEVYEVF